MLGYALTILLLVFLASLGRADRAWVALSIFFALTILAGMARVVDGLSHL